MQYIFKYLLAVIFPYSEREAYLLSRTGEELRERLLPAPTPTLPDTIALFSYRDKLCKALIWNLKYYGHRDIARSLADALYPTLLEELSDRQLYQEFLVPVLIPIPLSPSRMTERGYNQAELIAQALIYKNKDASYTLLPHALTRTRDTGHQARLESREKRLHNLTGAFYVPDPSVIKNKDIVLIDDVITTGATMTEAKKTLLSAGAKRVLCVAVAH